MAKFIKDLGLIPDKHGKNYRWCIVECEECKTQRPLKTAKYNRYPDRLCKKCANKNKNAKTLEDRSNSFIQQAINIHGDRFDYSSICYNGYFKEISITCKKCNAIFNQTPSNHLRIKECPICTNKGKYTQEEFVNKCKEVHPSLDYSNTKFKGMQDDIHVYCSKHGTFSVNAGNHLYKENGCLSCSDWGDNNCLYVWRLGDTNMYKIGITSLRYGTGRISKVCSELNTLLGTNYSYNVIEFREVANALEIEKHLHTIFDEVPLTHSKLNGKTEFRILSEEDLKLLKSILDDYATQGLLS